MGLLLLLLLLFLSPHWVATSAVTPVLPEIINFHLIRPLEESTQAGFCRLPENTFAVRRSLMTFSCSLLGATVRPTEELGETFNYDLRVAAAVVCQGSRFFG